MATAASKRFSAAWPWKLRIKKRLGETGRLPVFCGSAMAAACTAEEAEEKGSTRPGVSQVCERHQG